MTQPTRDVSLFELFRGFATIGLLGFGGVAAISRHIIVEKSQWLSEKEYATILGMGQVLPGPNVVNASVVIGDRFQGVKGSLISVLGLMVPPICILLILASLYDSFSHLPGVNVALIGGAAAAAGMIVGTGLKMAQKIKPGVAGWLIIVAVLVSILVLKWPLVYVVLGLIPSALALTYWLSKK
ncbi:MAG: chromate transporter [Burkholderiales bacterium]|jgi:chromate transporter|nr:chromate transporter [Burkholderiales bacterium]